MESEFTAKGLLAYVVAPLVLAYVIFTVYKSQQPVVKVPDPEAATKSTIITWTGESKSTGFLGDESMAALSDFPEWKDGNEVDFAAVLKATPARITPYCLDLPRQRVIFVEVEPEDLERAISKGEIPFVYQAQRKYATKAYGVPFSTFARLATEQAAGGWDSDVMLLQSTGRCGSTLLSKLLEATAGIRSLSEPDIFTEIAVHEIDSPGWATPEEKVQLIRGVMWVLHGQSHAAAPGKPKLCVKFRSQVVYMAGLLDKALPRAKAVFLYRNPVDTIDSYAMAFFSTGLAKAARWAHLDSFFIFKLSPLGGILHLLAPLSTNHADYPEHLYKPLGILGLNAMSYMSNMDAALKLLQTTSVFSSTIRYEDLVEHRTLVVERVLSACGMETGAMLATDATAKVFDEDAHAGGTLVSARRAAASKEPLFIQPSDFVALKALLAANKGLGATDYILPGTETDFK